MPDTDVLAEAFADFAERAGREVISPGAGAVRRTVRHRRARRTVATAFALVLAVVGGVAIWGRPDSRGPVLANPAAQRLEPLRVQAVDALPSVRSVLTSDSLALLGNYTDPERDVATPNGPVTVYFTCVGSGVVTFEISIGGGTATTEVGCSSAPGASSWHVQELEGPGYLFVHLRPDSVATGQSAFAYTVVDGPDQTGVHKR